MKILCACRNMNHVAGGVEKMLSTLMNELVRRGHDVSLLTWDPPEAQNFFPLDPDIAWHKLALGNSYQKAGWALRLSRARKVRGIVRQERPDIILTFQNGAFLSLWGYTLGMNIPVIVAERNAPTMYDHTKSGRHKFLWMQAYGLSPRLVVQTESQKKMYPAWIQAKTTVIANPVFAQDALPAPARDPKILLCVGRLGYQKNQRVLLEAFARIYKEVLDWKLRLVGHGSDLEFLKIYADKHGFGARLEFTGDVKDVLPHYREADLFCLPSRWEGFPNALAEALACGIPAIGFADCAGVNDLILPETNGLLAAGNNDPATLAQALLTLMQHKDRRDAFRARAPEIAGLYRPEGIFTQWEETLRKAAR